jgi:7-cyano-7-deazaguanine synthase
VHALTFDYGQRHVRETSQAALMTSCLAERGYTVSHEFVSIPDVLRGTSPLVDRQRPVESYASAEVLPGGLEKTFVPMRNALFLVLAANRAVVLAEGEMVEVIIGVSQEDYGGYPDCRESFIRQMQRTVEEALDDENLPVVKFYAPLMHRSKKETVELAESLPLGRMLNALSHTCYKGESPPCGVCHACLLRAKGYAEAGVKDPIVA